MPILAFTQAPAAPRQQYDVDERLLFELRKRIGADDSVLALLDDYEVQLGAQGLDGGSVDLLTSTPAGWDGDLVDDISSQPVEVFLPILVDGNGSLEGLVATKRSLREFTNPRRGPYRTRVTRPSGAYREIAGLRTQFVDGGLDADSWGVTWQKVGLVQHCSDPFWVEPDTAWHVEWNVRDDTASPLPILPLAPGTGQALGDTNDVTVYGDVDTDPVWKITGPLEAVTVRDVARGLRWTLTASIGDGETWTVDCRRGRQGVFDPTGARSRGALSADAYLWGLSPGVSQVQTTVTGASAGASVVGDAPSRWESYA